MSMTPVRRRGAVLAVGVLSAALALAGCSSDALEETTTADTATRTVEADNGTIEIPADPQRVVVIGNTTLSFLDMGGEPVGVTELSTSELDGLSSDERAIYEAATVLASSADEIDMEELASLEPDLILAQFPASEFEQLESQLESISPTVFWGLDVEWKELAEGLGEAGNRADTVSAQKAEFEEKLAGIQETYADVIAETSFVNVDRYASSDSGTFVISDIGCVEIARDDVGMNFPEAAEGEDPLAWTAMPFEQLGELSEYDVITYPVDSEGQPKDSFASVVETSTWQALSAVTSGRALGLYCPGNNSYGQVLQYLDSLDSALATLPTNE